MHFGLLNNGVFIAILAHTLIGLSLVWDKILLKQTRSQSVVNYVFWLGAMSVFGSILAFFGMHLPSLWVIVLAFFAGAVQLVANYFYYEALNIGEASQTLAIMGGFSPLATVLFGIPILKGQLEGEALWAFALMTAGGFLMFFSERVPVRKLLPLVISAAVFFGASNVMQKRAFEETNFVSGYVFFTIGTFVCALCLLVRKTWRDQIFKQSEEAQPRNKFWYFVNRFISGVGSFLIFFAISRANPALVDAISGLRYAIIFVGAYWITKWRPRWLKEDFRTAALWTKAVATGLVVAGLVLLAMAGDGATGSVGA